MTEIYDMFIEMYGPHLRERLPQTEWFMFLFDAGGFRHALRICHVSKDDEGEFPSFVAVLP